MNVSVGAAGRSVFTDTCYRLSKLDDASCMHHHQLHQFKTKRIWACGLPAGALGNAVKRMREYTSLFVKPPSRRLIWCLGKAYGLICLGNTTGKQPRASCFHGRGN